MVTSLLPSRNGRNAARLNSGARQRFHFFTQKRGELFHSAGRQHLQRLSHAAVYDDVWLAADRITTPIQIDVRGRGEELRQIRWIPSRGRLEQFHEARFVRIAQGAFTIWLDPFGVLDP
jgi:hypothetical protein